MARLAPLLLALLAGFTAEAQENPAPGADAPARAPKICFVDLQKVFDAYAQKKTREKALNAEIEVERKKLTQLVQQAKALQEEIKQLAPNTNHTRKKIKELFLLQRKVAFQKRWVEVDLTERMTAMLAKLYREILVGVDRFAERGGYDAVFQVNKNPMKAKSADRLRMLIREKAVLYYRKDLDKTAAVIKLLNSPRPPKKAPK